MQPLSPPGRLSLSKPLQGYTDAEGEALANLHEISRVNLLVGPNNCGKSRLLRHIASDPTPIGVVDGDADNAAKRTSQAISGIWRALHEQLELRAVTAVGNVRLSKLKELAHNYNFTTLDRQAILTHRSWSLTIENGEVKTNRREAARPAAEKVADAARQIHSLLSAAGRLWLMRHSNKFFYIPVLRGLRPLRSDVPDPYKVRTTADYFEAEGLSTPEIFTGLDLYTRVRDMLLGALNERRAVAKFEEFLSKSFFEGRTVALVPRREYDVVNIRIGREAERPIYSLGDGLQSLVILTFLAVVEAPSVFFIEEPELSLHPGMQRRLLSFYAESPHLVFMTTQSNHMLDLTADISDVSIYSVRKCAPSEGEERDAQFEVVNLDDGTGVLFELGARASSVFVVNATIWVEGVTDRRYLRRLLALYQDVLGAPGNAPPQLFEEDTHYAFVEYGGSNITHWSFLEHANEPRPMKAETLCGRAFVIADRDGVGTKLARKAALKEKLGDRFLLLDVREIENLLSPRILRKIIESLEKRSLTEKEAARLTEVSYADCYLGEYIEQIVLAGEQTYRYTRTGSSGTIRDKVRFCNLALQYISTEDIKGCRLEVAKRMYQFVAAENRL